MALIKGTATGYQTMVDSIFEAITRISMQEWTIDDAGTGYSVDDVLTISGGTHTIQAQLVVTSVGGGGEITGVRLENSGCYTVAPSGTSTPVTGGTGTDAKFDTVWDGNGWQGRRMTNVTNTVQSATVAAGGSGYTVGDTINVVGGDNYVSAQFQVLTAPGGVVGTVGLVNGGNYGSQPSNAVATSGGTGSGCTLNLSWGGSGQRELIVEGEGIGGLDEIIVGLISEDGGSGALRFRLLGASGFNPGLAFSDQPGACPIGTTGAVVPMSTLSTSYYIFVNPRRIVCVARISTSYMSFYLGFLDAFATETEYPYPLYVAGTTSNPALLYTSSTANVTGFAHPARHTASANGCAMLRQVDGSWRNIANYENGSLNTGNDQAVSSPGGRLAPSASLIPNSDNQWYATTPGSFQWNNIVAVPGGTPTVTIARSPGNVTPTFPITVIQGNPNPGIMGQLDGVVWFDARGVVSAEDVLVVSGGRYRAFPSGNFSDPWLFYGVLEA